ncbi:MAG: UMP kinase [Candidatus Nanoarchaeia archaeon]|nr:UMP kinase [Candidatus Nanoarchaeia archaeon]
MQKELIVLSLGGSLIIPGEVDAKFLKEFRRIILKHAKKYKFIIVCGGGSIARKYISVLKEFHVPQKVLNLMGMESTRMNTELVASLFNKEPLDIIAKEEEIGRIRKILGKNSCAFVEAGKYHPNKTSDSGSALMANHFRTNFINLTNVPGLYDKNPKKYKDAKFIPDISWKGLYKMANQSKFQPGQHFVIDQTASRIIMENRITTYILGKNLTNLDNLLYGRKFTGTIVSG